MVRRSALIIDDIKTNRLILQRIIGDDYAVCEAENEIEARRLIREKYATLSVCFINLEMPGRAGVNVLTQMRQNPMLATIPVIVTFESYDESAEIEALRLGANDCVSMPYNRIIILQRIKNVVSLRERSAIFNVLQRDKLTGIYNRESFFRKVQEMTQRCESGYYLMSSFNINHFKIINERYGLSVGDEVLLHVAQTLDDAFKPIGGICARITADNFAILYPQSQMNAAQIEAVRLSASRPKCLDRAISFSTGRYVVDDTALSASAMYDRAVIAAASVKARYDQKIAVFDQSMLESVFLEQEISNEMKQALETGEFEAWFQPQYDHSNGSLIGAEALARWRHRKKGMIQPDAFIPIFERNGFVYELDKYIWKLACETLRGWLDEGLDPPPVSVNVSRYDLLREDFYRVITGLVARYDIPVRLLRLEITETAFAKSAERIIEMVKRLMSFGFVVEIDDFGNGYSSLNTLKNVPASVLKLDMRFLQGDANSTRGGSIMEAIVRMAKWLGMPVIAEGVETKEQADYLMSIGCFFVQGYLYARPMPVNDYDALVRAQGAQTPHLPGGAPEEKLENPLWDPDSIDTLIFNNYVGGACIIEYRDGEFELLRINEKYASALGGESLSMQDAMRIYVFDYLDQDAVRDLRLCVEHALGTRGESSCELRFKGLPGDFESAYIRMTFKPIARSGENVLLFTRVENVTELRESAPTARDGDQAALANTMPYILSAIMEASTDICFAKDRFLRYICLSPGFVKMVGAKSEKDIIGKTDYEIFSKEDADKFHEDDLRLMKSGRSLIDMTDRLPDVNGVPHYFKSSKYILRDTVGNIIGIYGVSRDITEYKTAFEHLRLVNDSMPAGLGTCAYCGGKMMVSYINDGYCAILGLEREVIENSEGGLPMGDTFDEDKPLLREKFAQLIKTGGPIECTYRIRVGGGFKWIRHRAVVTDRKDGDMVINAVIYDMTEEMQAAEKLRLSEEQYRLAVKNSGKIVYRYNVSSRSIDVSPEAEEIFGRGLNCANVPDDIIAAGAVAPESVASLRGLYERINLGERTGGATANLRVRDGSFRWFEFRFSTILDSGGNPTMAIILIDDITQRLEKEAVYKKWQQSLLDKKPCDYTLFRCNLSKNASFDTLEGRLLDIEFSPDATSFKERTMEYVKKRVYASDWDRYIAALDPDTLLANYYRGKRSATLEYREARPEGGRRWLRLTIELVEYPNSSDIEAYLMYENIDDRKREELLTIERARSDSLTGVLNRAAFIAGVAEATRTAAVGVRHALLMVDIDNFREINNRFGHSTGDMTLVETADTLKSVVRSGDLLGRIGGDEFIILLKDCPDDASIRKMAGRICEVMRKSLGNQTRLSASIGIAVYPKDADSFEALYKKADAALYSVKDAGKDSFAFFAE